MSFGSVHPFAIVTKRLIVLLFAQALGDTWAFQVSLVPRYVHIFDVSPCKLQISKKQEISRFRGIRKQQNQRNKKYLDFRQTRHLQIQRIKKLLVQRNEKVTERNETARCSSLLPSSAVLSVLLWQLPDRSASKSAVAHCQFVSFDTATLVTEHQEFS